MVLKDVGCEHVNYDAPLWTKAQHTGLCGELHLLAQGLISILPQLIPPDGKGCGDETPRDTSTASILTDAF